MADAQTRMDVERSSLGILLKKNIWSKYDMVKIGNYNTLKVVKKVQFGVYLDGDESGEILLPGKYVPAGCEPGVEVEVFIYLDSEDMIIATTQKPNAVVGDFALLKAIHVDSVGVFLDWGLQKDLLVPYSEQQQKMEEGYSYLVYVFLDKNTNRIAASSKLTNFLDKERPLFEEGQEVDLIIGDKTDIGYKAIINGSWWGMLYENELYSRIKKGQKMKGYIKKLREDDKVDLTIHKPGYEKIDGIAGRILETLKAQDGFLVATDKSSPEIIYKLFGISKKSFKKAIGALYKKRLITLERNGIKLVE